MLGKIIASSTFVAVTLLCVLLVTTAPTTAGPLGVLAVFVLMYVSALGVLTFLLYGMSVALAKVVGVAPITMKHEALTLRKAYYYASIVALAPIMLIAMQSVNEVGFYQLLLVVLFVIIAWTYVAKRTA